MSLTPKSIKLFEWEEVGPSQCSDLSEYFLDSSAETQQIALSLTKGKMLKLRELRTGLQINAFSHVGKIRLGDLTITIQPKIKGASLLSLVRYAYGYRRLNLFPDSVHDIDNLGIEDLLIFQLNSEIQELVSRGLLRVYIVTNERLSSLRGRIDINRMAMDGCQVTGTLPCHHHPRIEDTLLNQVLLAGLELAASLASVVDLRRDSRRLATLLTDQVSVIHLDRSLLDRAARAMNRLTAVYGSALSIIRLLIESQGVVLEGQTVSSPMPGFLFDMNAFFQALVSRFLGENLHGCIVRDELGLKGMMRYTPGANPKNRQSPTPRPDYIVMQNGLIRAILDAKYRDLWEKPLPSKMLYQLVVYAVSNPQHLRSRILYPTMDKGAVEARIDVNDPIYGKPICQVCLKPVHLPTLAELVTSPMKSRSDREDYARRLAFSDPYSD